MSKSKKNKPVRMFETAFDKKVMLDVIKYYVELMEPAQRTPDELMKTLRYSIEMVFGRIFHEFSPIIEQTIHNEKILGYSFKVEAICDKEKMKALDLEFSDEEIIKFNDKEKVETIVDNNIKKVTKKV